MMSLPIVITTQSVPKSYVPPTDMQGILEAIPQYTTYVLNDTGAYIDISATNPLNTPNAAAVLAGLWVWMLNQYKLPPRLMTGYKNNFWQLYTGLPGEVRMFMGAPAGYFDATGRGIEGSGWEGWALCNGNNNTVNLSNRFIVPGYRWDGGGWVTNVSYFDVTQYQSIMGGDAYGNPGPRQLTIQRANLPKITVSFNATDFYKWTKTGTGELWSAINPGGSGPGGSNAGLWVYSLDQSKYMYNIPTSSIPPYIATGYVQFVGYL